MNTTFARRADGKLIKAKKGIDRTLPFHCPGCKLEVYAATEGKKQRPHFRHKSLNGNTGCSEPESYVHWVTKELFAEEYQSLESFHLSISVQQQCIQDSNCTKEKMVTIDLKERYPNIEVEKYDDGLRPDCMLSNDQGEKVYFEAHYTSRVTDTKRERGIPIIEVTVYDTEGIDEIVNKKEITDADGLQPSNGKKKNYSVMIHNEEALIPKENYSFDCIKNCIDKKPMSLILPAPRKTQYRTITNNETKLKPKHTYPGALYRGDIPYGISSQEISTEDYNQAAIEYLAKHTGNHSTYATKTAMPHVIAKSVQLYNENYKKFNRCHTSDNTLMMLVEESSFMFIEYGDIFFGALRYEAKWHIFSMNNNNISFIESVLDNKEVDFAIRRFTDIF